MKEMWRPVVGWEDLYEVSDHGRVRSLDRIGRLGASGSRKYKGRVLRPIANELNYQKVSLCRDRHHEIRRIHRLVLEAFIGPCPPGMETRHRDGDPANNHLTNLRWGTKTDNNLDQVRHGTQYWAARDTCGYGHALESRNLTPSKVGSGRRDCLACRRAHGATYRDRRDGRPERDFRLVADGQYLKIMNESP